VGSLETVYYYKCSPDSDSEISLNIGQYLMKLSRMEDKANKKGASFFGPPCIGQKLCRRSNDV